MFVVDVFDTYMKGAAHFKALGLEYELRIAIYSFCSLVAIKVRSERLRLPRERKHRDVCAAARSCRLRCDRTLV